MAAISVRDLSEHTLLALKRRAKAHHRSLQGEVRAILEEAASTAPPESGYPPLRLKTTRTGCKPLPDREAMYDDELR